MRRWDSRDVIVAVRRVLNRRSLTSALGVIWIFDGLLQLQPFMFTRGFITGVLQPAALSQPPYLTGFTRAIDQLIAPHILVWNPLFAAVQIGIGIGMLFKRTKKVALVLSLAWVIPVWWIGEGFGGLLTGSATPVTGAPGAVLLYGILAVILFPVNGRDCDGPVAELGPLGSLGTRVIWAVLWLAGAALCLLPANSAPDAISSVLRDAGSGEPHLLASLDRGASLLTAGHGKEFAIVLAALQVTIALGVLVRWHPAVFLALGVGIATIFWVVGQDFGGIFTGQGTDPNAGPLLVLLAATIAGTAHRELFQTTSMSVSMSET